MRQGGQGVIDLGAHLDDETRRRICDHVKILFLTAADVEHQSVREHLKPVPDRLVDDKAAIIEFEQPCFARVGLIGGYMVAHIALDKQGSSSIPVPLMYISRTFPEIRLVVMPGIAFGFHSQEHDANYSYKEGYNPEQQMGHILVATHFVDANSHKPENQLLNPWVFDQALQLGEKYKPSRQSVRVWSGGILCVHEKLNDRIRRDLYKKDFAIYDNGDIRCIGGEMEGIALYDMQQTFIAHPDLRQFDTLLIKSICDWGFNKASPPKEGEVSTSERDKHNNEERMPAAQNSMDFIEFLFNEKNSLPSRTHNIKRYEPPKEGPTDDKPKSYNSVGNVKAEGDEEIRRVGIIRSEGYAPGNNVKEWAKRLVAEANALRVLVIPGESGRGKTFFAKQLRQELEAQHKHCLYGWIDCTSQLFSSNTIRKLLEPFLPSDEKARFHNLFPEDEAASIPATPLFNGQDERTKYLKNGLFAKNATPFYLYLDDAHRYMADLGDDRSTLVGFISSFLMESCSLRLILTSRDSKIEKKLADRLGGSGYSAVKIAGVENEDIGSWELSPFTQADTIKYFEKRKEELALVQEDKKSLLAQYAEGDPLLLDFIADHLQDLRTKNMGNSAVQESAAFLDKIIERGRQIKAENNGLPEAERKSLRAELRDFVLDNLIARWPPEVRRLATALAVLKDLNYLPPTPVLEEERGAYFKALLEKMLNGLPYPGGISPDQNHATLSFEETLYDLETRNIVTVGSLDFIRDPVQEHLYNKTLKSEEREEWHSHAATAFEEQNEKRLLNRALDVEDFIAWHEIASDKLEEAFERVQKINSAYKAAFRYEELRRLRLRFRQKLRPRLYAEWAINQGELGEVLYQGFNLTDSVEGNDSNLREQGVYDLINDAIEADDKHTYHDKDAKEALARFKMMLNILFFENNKRLPADLAEESAKPDAYKWLVARTQELEKKLEIFPEHPGGINPPLAALMYCFEGCYYNRGEELEGAIASFRQAEQILASYPESSMTEAQKNRLHQDRMDIANSWSRSRFLLHGPAAAINGTKDSSSDLEKFAEFVKKTPDALRSRQEYSYCLIDLCYYWMALGDWSELRATLDAAYRSELSPSAKPSPKEAAKAVWNRPKRFADLWVEYYFNAMECAYHWYASESSPKLSPQDVVEGFLMNADSFGEFPRDVGFFMANAILLQMSLTKKLEERSNHLCLLKLTLKISNTDNEPIARDLVGYLEAALEVGGHPDDSNPAVKKTWTRFPAFFGAGKPDIRSRDWKAPILLRGALIMRPNYCAPTFEELGIDPAKIYDTRKE